jgi:hypothetical protein
MITSLSPASASTGGPAFTLVVNGSDFVSGAAVTWDGADRGTTFVSSSRVDASIPASDLALGKSVPVVVRNPSGVLSNAMTFPVNNPRPTLTSVSPDKASGGGTGLTLTLTGSNFAPNAKALWNGIDVATTYISPTEVRGTLTEQDLAQAGDFEVSVTNPSPAGGVSESIVVPVSDFGMTATPAEVTTKAGQSASYSVEVTPQHGSFDAAVTFICSGLPSRCTATFSPANVTPGATAATVALTLATKAPQRAAGATAFGPTRPVPPEAGLLLLAGIFSVLALVLRKTVLRPGRRIATAAALALLTLWLAGCGAGGKVDNPDQGTPPGTYHVGVQATSGSLTVLTSVTLIVN